MKKTELFMVPVLFSLTLAGCVSAPEAPTVMVLPGSGKTYETFQRDDVVCRNTAYRSLNGEAHDTNNNGITTAATGAVIGAAAGALIGSAGGPQGTTIGDHIDRCVFLPADQPLLQKESMISQIGRAHV